SFRFYLSSTLMLTDLKDHELGWLYRCDPNAGHNHPRIDTFRRVGLFIALYKESVFRGLAHKRTVSPKHRQESAHIARKGLPKGESIGFKDDPAGAQRNRLFNHVEQTPDIQIAPLA